MPRELEQYVDSTKEKQKNISDSLWLAYEYERKNLTQDYYSDLRKRTIRSRCERPVLAP